MQTTFMEFMKEKDFPFYNFYYLAGDDYFLHQIIARRLMNKYIDEGARQTNYTVFQGHKNAKTEDLRALLASYSIFSEYKIVHIKNADDLDSQTKLKLLDSFKEVPDKTIIILSADTARDKGEFESFIKKNGRNIKCVLSEHDVHEYIKLKLKKQKVEIKADAVAAIVNKIGISAALLDCELEKLAAYAKQGGAITKTDVDHLIKKNTVPKIYHLSDLIAKKNLKEAVSVLEELVREEGKDFTFLVIGYLNKHFRNLLAVKSMLVEGVPANKAAQELGMRLDWQFKQCMNQASNFTIDELARCFDYFQKADFNIKNSQDPLLVLELMLTAMCGK